MFVQGMEIKINNRENNNRRIEQRIEHQIVFDGKNIGAILLYTNHHLHTHTLILK